MVEPIYSRLAYSGPHKKAVRRIETMQLFPEQLALINLRGEVHPSEREYMSREEAFAMLRETAPVDFGEDIEKWQAWVDEKYSDVPRKVDCD